MAESAQSLSSRIAAAREKLFGTPSRSTKRPSDESGQSTNLDSKTETASDINAANEKPNERETVDSIWEKRWDESPQEWREFIAANPRVYGLTQEEQNRIISKNRNYVSTKPLSGNGCLGTAMIAGTVGLFGKLLMTKLNDFHMYNMEILYDAIEKRDASQGLLTFANHQSVLDDPFLLAASLPRRILLRPDGLRWGLCSLDICFQSALVSWTLRLGKALPIQRLGGIGQSFLRIGGEKLINGDWVHIFPEGRIRQRGMGYSKRGVGKMLAMYYEAHQGLPLVLPLYHEGVERVMPQKAHSNDLRSRIPRTGKRLFIMSGEPIDLNHIFQRLMPACIKAGGTSTDPPPCLRLYEEVADSMAITMRLLRAELRQKVRSESEDDLGEPFELS